LDSYDVIIIGSGAGGGTLARHLAPSGKRILIIERGDYVPREPDNWSTLAVNVKAKYNTKEQWYDRTGKALHPHTNYFVGGNTKFYGAALFRLRKDDFGELKEHMQVNRILFGSDYPHPEGTEHPLDFLQELTGYSMAEKEMVMSSNLKGLLEGVRN